MALTGTHSPWFSVFCLVVFTLAALASHCLAGKAAERMPALAKPGKVVFEQGAATGKLAKPWTAAKGDWQFKEGVPVGREKAEDQHAAVPTRVHPHRDSIIRFSFKLDGATGFNLSFNHAKGHLFRIGIIETGLVINKDEEKKGPASKIEKLGQAAG
jgi:hypothetical protein